DDADGGGATQMEDLHNSGANAGLRDYVLHTLGEVEHVPVARGAEREGLLVHHKCLLAKPQAVSGNNLDHAPAAVEPQALAVTHLAEDAGAINNSGLANFAQQDRGMAQFTASLRDHSANAGEYHGPRWLKRGDNEDRFGAEGHAGLRGFLQQIQ